MYAVVNIAGQQFKVTETQKLYVPLLAEEIGSTVEFSEVLMFSDGNALQIGTPSVANASVTAKVLAHIKDEKVIVFKKKRRKGFRKLNGHRQRLTQIEIERITK
ncbi:MAG: 50S ribosomal protein L21 [Ignavibacteria bacterium]|nr:50S ribosomal protein L21 [Ignavibacteria bacterium]